MKLVTLIIPTYNRPDFLERILTYYNNYGVKFKIIVADSSTPQNKKTNKKIIQSFPKLDVLHLNHFSPKLVSHYKFAKMVAFAKTEYVCFCADDDFIVPNGIKKAIEFLEKHPDYNTAHGTYTSFCTIKNLLGSNKFIWKFIYPFESIVAVKAEERLTKHFLNYEQVLYAVRRTNTVKACYREFTKSGSSPVLFGEFLPDMLTLIYGKMKRINTLYASRQAFSSVYNYWPTLKDAIKQGTYDKEYTKFKKCLITNLTRHSSISKENAERLIDTNMHTYLKTTWQQHLLGRLSIILRNYPRFLSSWLRGLHIRYLFLKDKKDRVGKIDDHANRYFQDFDRIRKLVLD